MLSFNTQKRLADYISVIGAGERNIENLRQRLAEYQASEPYTIFRRIDRLNNNFISTADLTNFFSSNEQFLSYSEIRSIFNQLDANKDNRITYEEFSNYILPHSNAALKQICQNRASYYCAVDEYLQYEIEICLLDMFRQISINQKQYEIYRNDLVSSYDFNIRDCFDVIDANRRNFLDADSVSYFAKTRQNVMSYLELDSFMDYADTDKEGVVSFRKFCDLVLNSQMSINFDLSNSMYLSPSKRIAQPRISLSPRSRVYISPSKRAIISNIQLSPSRVYLSPSKRIASPVRIQQSVIYQSPLKSVASLRQKQEVAASIIRTNSPGGRAVNQSQVQDQIQKIEDNGTYQNYLRNSRQKSIEKSLVQSQNSFYSPSRARISRQELRMSPSRVISQQILSPSRSRLLASSTYVAPEDMGSVQILKRSAQIKQAYQSPVKQIEEDQLCNLLKSMIQYDRELEQSRQSLAFRNDFCLMDAFRLFDVAQKTYVSKYELEKALNKLGVYPKYNDLALFMNKFDQDRDSFINFAEFSKVLYPQSQELIDLMNSRQPQYVEPLEGESAYSIWTFETQRIFKQIFAQVFDAEDSLDQIRQSLQRRPNFNLYDAFNAMDFLNMGTISYEEVKALLETHGIFTTQNDMISLFKQFDKGQKGKIGYGEFVEEIRPKSPVKKRILY